MFRVLTCKNLLLAAIALSVAFLFFGTVNACIPVSVASAKEVSLPVIMYHQISENKSIFGAYVIPPSLLEEDFSYMKENGFTPVSLKELEKYLNEGAPLPEKPVLLTFDDGERSFLTKVVPLLEKYSFPANVNVIGSLTELYTKNGETDDRYAYLNENDIRILSENPLVELGCHTFDLHSLSNRRGMGRLRGESNEEYIKIITEDIRRFNALFEKITGKGTPILAYPYGIRNELLFKTAKELGFTITLTCREEINRLSHDGNLYELGRFNRPYGKTSEEFFSEMLG